MHCIVVFKTILYLDDILPLVMELAEANLVAPSLFLAWNRKTYNFVRKNYVLYDAVRSTGARLECLNRFQNRVVNQIWNVWVLRTLLYKKTASLETYDSGNRWVKILTWLNRSLFRGRKIRAMILNRPFKQAKKTMEYYRAVKGDFSVRKQTITGCDCLVLSHSKEEFEQIQNVKLTTDCPIVTVGYTRGLRQWQHFLKMEGEKYLNCKVQQPYVFFPLTAIGATFTKGEDSISLTEKLIESLVALRDFNQDVLTVFKPHQKTDLDGVEQVLRSVGFRNYVVSYLHPHILIKGAKFTFCYHPTSLFIDAYFLGCPTVEYAHYDSRFFKLNKGRPRYLECIDYFVYRDMDHLRRIFKDLIYCNEIPIKRDMERIAKGFQVLTSEKLKEVFSGFF